MSADLYGPNYRYAAVQLSQSPLLYLVMKVGMWVLLPQLTMHGDIVQPHPV
jgi:hypothetical protein